MARFHDYHLRRDKLEGAAIGIRALDVAASQKADMRMHAERRAHERLQMRGPAEARRIDETLHTAVRRWDAVDGDAAKFLVGGAFDGGKQGIHGLLPSKCDALFIQAESNVRTNHKGCQEEPSPNQPEESPTWKVES